MSLSGDMVHRSAKKLVESFIKTLMPDPSKSSVAADNRDFSGSAANGHVVREFHGFNRSVDDGVDPINGFAERQVERLRDSVSHDDIVQVLGCARPFARLQNCTEKRLIEAVKDSVDKVRATPEKPTSLIQGLKNRLRRPKGRAPEW